MSRLSIDVSDLPTTAFGPRNLTWWANLGIMAIEGTVFALAIASYFYLRSRVTTWPPNLPPPALLYGTINTVIMIASLVPNQLAKRAALREDLSGSRLWEGVALVFTLAFLVFRVFEFASLNCRWYTNAYGSAVWALISFHTAHLVTEAIETAVLVALLLIGPIQAKRFVDVTDNTDYWYFVVGSWMPIYVVLYWAPRWLS